MIRLLKEKKDNYNERDDMANDTFFMMLLKIHECMSKKLPSSPNYFFNQESISVLVNKATEKYGILEVFFKI